MAGISLSICSNPGPPGRLAGAPGLPNALRFLAGRLPAVDMTAPGMPNRQFPTIRP